MWTKVHYGHELREGEVVRVRRTGHISEISEVVGRPKIYHCKVYRLRTPDPDVVGTRNWYFSHELNIKI